jgi:hypothetical protein
MDIEIDEKLRIVIGGDNYVVKGKNDGYIGKHRRKRARIDVGRDALKFVACKDVPEDKVVCKIPKSAIFSIKNSRYGEILEEEEIGGALGLTIAMLLEMLSQEESQFKPYFNMLPFRQCIPILYNWSSGNDKRCMMLRGTEVEAAIHKELILLRQDYQTLCEFVQRHEDELKLKEKVSWKAFLKVTSLVASRSFEVDAEHGVSMVPIADIFNHRTLNEHVHLETSDFNSHQEDYASDEGFHVDSDGVIEVEAKRHIEISASEDDGVVVEESDEAKKEAVDLIEIRVINAVQKNEEVFNTYGEHNNAYLLMKYGFCEENNPFDSVNIDLAQVLMVLKESSDLSAEEEEDIRHRFMDSDHDDDASLTEEDEEHCYLQITKDGIQDNLIEIIEEINPSESKRILERIVLSRLHKYPAKLPKNDNSIPELKYCRLLRESEMKILQDTLAQLQ